MEDLIDWIREVRGRFRFKASLGEAFPAAQLRAIHGLSLGKECVLNPDMTVYENWLQVCWICYGVLGLRYLQNLLRISPTIQNPERPQEWEIWREFAELEEVDEKTLAELMDIIREDHRNKMAHTLERKGGDEGELFYRLFSSDEIWEKFKKSRRHFADDRVIGTPFLGQLEC